MRNVHRRSSRKNGATKLDSADRGKPDARKVSWQAYVAKHQLKFSKAREEIIDTFLATDHHIALQELLAFVKRRNPRIGLATVYRALKLLEDAGIAQARQFGDRSTVYEVAIGREHHDHLICESCGAILEFADADIERIQEEVARKRGFTLRRHRHELFGLCAACLVPASGAG